MFMAKRRVCLIYFVAICILVLIQCNVLVEESSEPVILLSVLLCCFADTVGDNELIIVLDILSGTLNDPLQNGPAAVFRKVIAVVLYLISLIPKPAVKRYNDQPIQLLPLPRSLWQLYDLYKLLKLLYLGVSQW